MKPGLEPGMTYTTEEGRQTPPSILAISAEPATYWIGDIAGTMERTARRWLTEFMEEDEQTVGVEICVTRAEPLAHGERIIASATLRRIDGRRYFFEVAAVNEHGAVLGHGTHVRALISPRRLGARPTAGSTPEGRS